MNSQGMESLGGMDVFVRAAEVRSFTEVGRQLGISSSAVGKAISRLEEKLGVRLFHRSTRSITLTYEGTVFLESCKRIFSEVEAAELELAQIKSAPSGRLKVGLPLVGMLLMPAISGFMTAYPEIDLDLDFSDKMVNVIDDGFDVVIRTGHIADSRLTAKTLGNFILRIVGAPGYFERHGTPLVPADLLNKKCLHHKFPTIGKLERWPLIPNTDGGELTLPSAIVTNTIEPLIQLAEVGHGIICVPDFAVRRELESGRLVSILEEYIAHTGSFRAVWPSSKFLSPNIRVFVQFMAENLFKKENELATRRL